MVQGDRVNNTSIRTAIVCSLSSNTGLMRVPGNVLIPAHIGGLRVDSVAVVSQISTLDLADFVDYLGVLPRAVIRQILDGVALVLGMELR